AASATAWLRSGTPVPAWIRRTRDTGSAHVRTRDAWRSRGRGGRHRVAPETPSLAVVPDPAHAHAAGGGDRPARCVRARPHRHRHGRAAGRLAPAPVHVPGRAGERGPGGGG